MAFTRDELEMLAKLEERCITSINQTAWDDEPLTEREKNVIGMAVSWTYARIKEEANGDCKKGNADPGR
jgi:hypothetical protein